MHAAPLTRVCAAMLVAAAAGACTTDAIQVSDGALAEDVNYLWLLSTREGERTVFSPMDEKVVLSVRFGYNYRASYEWYKVEWIDPSGRPYKVVSTRTEFGSHRDLKAELEIRGKMAAALPGLWQVRLSHLGRDGEPDRLLISRLFRIEAMTPEMWASVTIDAPEGQSRPLAGPGPGGVSAAPAPVADTGAAPLPVADAGGVPLPGADAGAAPLPVADAAGVPLPGADAGAAPLPVVDAGTAPPLVAKVGAAPPTALEAPPPGPPAPEVSGAAAQATSTPAAGGEVEAAQVGAVLSAVGTRLPPAPPPSAPAVAPPARSATGGDDAPVTIDAVLSRVGSRLPLTIPAPGRREWPGCPPLYYPPGEGCVEQAPQE